MMKIHIQKSLGIMSIYISECDDRFLDIVDMVIDIQEGKLGPQRSAAFQDRASQNSNLPTSDFAPEKRKSKTEIGDPLGTPGSGDLQNGSGD